MYSMHRETEYTGSNCILWGNCAPPVYRARRQYMFDFNQEKEILEKHAGSVQQIVF